MRNVVLLSGPACVGKGPLMAAVRHYRPDIRFGEVPVMKSIESRGASGLRATDDPAHFFPAATIKNWETDKANFIVGDCRNFPQAIKRTDVEAAAESNDVLFAEAYYTLGRQFRGSDFLKLLGPDMSVATVFMSPMSPEAFIAAGVQGTSGYDNIRQMSIDAQVQRARFLGLPLDMEDYAKRAETTLLELASMGEFDRVIVNRDSEGHPNWNQVLQGGKVWFSDSGNLRGDALKSFEMICNILLGTDLAPVKRTAVLSAVDPEQYGVWKINELDAAGAIVAETEINGTKSDADSWIESHRAAMERIAEAENDSFSGDYRAEFVRPLMAQEGGITITDDGYHPEDCRDGAVAAGTSQARGKSNSEEDPDKDWVSKLHYREGDDVTDFDYGHGRWTE